MALLSVIISTGGDAAIPPIPPTLSEAQQVTSNWCELCGITGARRIYYLNFTAALETAGIYDKFIMGYGNEGDVSLNFFDPENTDSAFRRTFTTPPTLVPLGAEWNAQYGDSHADWTLVGGSPNIGGSYYLQNSIQHGFIGSTGIFKLYHSDSTTLDAYVHIATTTGGPISYTGSITNGFHLLQRKSDNDLEYWQGSVLKGSINRVADSFGEGNIRFNYVNFIQPETHVSSWEAIHQEMSSTEIAEYLSALNILMVNLGRHV